MTRRGLILAAHGSANDPRVNERIEQLVTDIRGLVPLDEILAAFHKGEPHFSRAIDAMSADEIVVVPVMTSAGYYCDTVLPRELARNQRYPAVAVRITDPIGLHPRVPDLIAARVDALCRLYTADRGDVSVAVVGHGTTRHVHSRRATIDLAGQLRRGNQYKDVSYAFLDEEPGVEAVLARSRGDLLVVVPFMIASGDHTRVDIPRRLGMAGCGEDLPRTQRIGSRTVVCDREFGSYAGVGEIIADLAADRDSLLSDPSKSQTTTNAAKLHVRAGRPTPRRVYRLGTRNSPLALWQARHVAEHLRALNIETELVSVSTSGDRQCDTPMADLPSVSPFTDDLDDAVRNGVVDLAVHSLKDLPLELDAGLALAAVLERGDAREALVSRGGLTLAELQSGATIGTSSPRRRAQILSLRPDLVPVPIRGSVDARVRQVEAGRFDAAVLALAGLARINLRDKVSEIFSGSRMMPAPAQAALAVVTRSDDAEAQSVAAMLNDHNTRQAVDAELSFLRKVECLYDISVAAYAMVTDRIHLAARLVNLDGASVVDVIVEGDDPACVGAEAAERAAAKSLATLPLAPLPLAPLEISR